MRLRICRILLKNVATSKSANKDQIAIGAVHFYFHVISTNSSKASHGKSCHPNRHFAYTDDATDTYIAVGFMYFPTPALYT